MTPRAADRSAIGRHGLVQALSPVASGTCNEAGFPKLRAGFPYFLKVGAKDKVN